MNLFNLSSFRDGCGCPSCRETNRYTSFAEWPTGNPAGRKSAADYAAHVSFGKRTPDRFIVGNLDPVGFYGLGSGTRAGVTAVLRRTFEVVT